MYDEFVSSITNTEIPFFYIPGNSDLRCSESKESIKHKSSECKNVIKGISVFAVNDCDRTISDEQFSELDKMGDNSIVFMHHPIKDAGVYLSIGFDGHRCEDYDGYKVHEMYDFLKTNSFKTIDELLCGD